MRNVTLAIAAVAMLAPGAAMAQNSASATANGSVRIIQPITISKTADMNFGRIMKPASGSGSVSLPNSSDTVSATTAVALSGITTSRAKFTISGEGGQAISITVPGSFTMAKGSDTIAVTLNPSLGTTGTLSGSLGDATAGTLALNVGGSFSLPAAQATGDYTGQFTVQVAYN